MKQLAQLIVKAISSFNPVIASAGCGCNIPHDYDLTETRRVYAELATEFDLNPDGMSGTVAGSCTRAPMEAFVRAWGEKNSVNVPNVWVQDGAIVLTRIPADHPLYAALRELTTQEVCDDVEAERRHHARRRA